MPPQKRRKMVNISNLNGGSGVSSSKRQKTAGNPDLGQIEKENECPTSGQGSSMIPDAPPTFIHSMESMQSKFHCNIKREDMTAHSNLGPTFQSFAIIREQLADDVEIDCDDLFANMPGLEKDIEPETDLDTDMDSDDEEDSGEDHNNPEAEADDIKNIYMDGLDVDWTEIEPSSGPQNPTPTQQPPHPAQSASDSTQGPGMNLPPHGPPKGYEYTPFVPKDAPRKLVGHIRTPPTIHKTLTALKDLGLIIRPKRKTGAGYKDPELDLWTRARLEGMQSMLQMYTDSNSRTYNNWGASSCQAAIGMGRGRYCARRLRELCRAFIEDRTVLPINPYGDWNESMLADENLRNEISIFLLSIGSEISAKKLMDFLDQPDIKEKHGIEKKISHRTACRYLNSLGYRYKVTPKGQYADGHERDDVVFYHENVFLPQWCRIQEWMATWDEKLIESAPSGSDRRIITWFHDESVFYAHDRHKRGWYHKDATAKPYAKGEGSSLMVADFVSADFGWLRSPDGKRSARRLFKPGKNRDGYFSNKEIQEQVRVAMDILHEFYPQFDHVFIYDNATTHLKRAEDALSARRMPKNIPKEGTNWGIEVTKHDPMMGKPIYKPNGSPEKIKICMKDTQLSNSEPQSLYFPEGHPRAGIFKGMAVILEERGFGDMEKKLAECKGFKCKVGATNCCCRRILYNQPDFVNVDSVLEAACNARGFQVLFLPKFHCELNFIEQCWGRAKSVYRTYPELSREDHLEDNTIRALESIPLPMMRKFSNRSLQFMDAYGCGLNGRQAAWALRKY